MWWVWYMDMNSVFKIRCENPVGLAIQIYCYWINLPSKSRMKPENSWTGTVDCVKNIQSEDSE